VDSIIQSFLYELIFTNYLFFLLLLVLFYAFHKYMKIWPRIIIVKILVHKNGAKYVLDFEKDEVKCFINGDSEDMSENPQKFSKWFKIMDKLEVAIKITKNNTSIIKSEIKSIKKLNSFEFTLSEEEFKALQKDGAK